MHLTADLLHDISREARTGLRECLKLIELHNRDRGRSFLNGPIVLTAVATWERFVDSLVMASMNPGWRLTDAGVNGKYQGRAPWPGLAADLQFERRSSSRMYEHMLDELLIGSAVLARPLTEAWQAFISTGWTGADALRWRWVEYSALPIESNRKVFQEAILGARSARHAVAHRIYHKMARDAQGGNGPEELAWCYVWQSDNTVKSSRGTPTIQHGYARGVVALFIQLVDQTVAIVHAENGWPSTRSRLPEAWFEPTIADGPCAGMTLWGSRGLYRHPG